MCEVSIKQEELGRLVAQMIDLKGYKGAMFVAVNPDMSVELVTLGHETRWLLRTMAGKLVEVAEMVDRGEVPAECQLIACPIGKRTGKTIKDRISRFLYSAARSFASPRTT